MSLGMLILTAAVTQNVILVHFLGPWPFPALLTSVRRSFWFSLAVTGALVWVSVLYAALYRYVLVPLSLEFLGTFLLLAILATSVLFWGRFLGTRFPFTRRMIERTMTVVFLNATLFVVPMALAEAVDTFLYVPLAALAAGIGLILAMVPVAAAYQHLSAAGLPRILRGNVIVLVATAVFALALQQLDGLLTSFTYPLW